VTFTRPDRWLGTWRDEDPVGSWRGAWDSRRRDRHLEITVDLFGRSNPALGRAIAAAAERVAGSQYATAGVEYGPLFTAPAAAPEGD
jgi:hypothetical protein